MAQSSNSIRSEPEVDCSYENIGAEPSAPDLETIINPVYATEEFLPRFSIIVEDYANTFHSVEFLDCDQPIVYTLTLTICGSYKLPGSCPEISRNAVFNPIPPIFF